MLKQFLLLACASVLMQSLLFSATSETSSSIKWFTNYEEAVNESKSSLKPLLLFFTGSDWCGWCNKLEEEALNTRDFAEAAGSKFVFLKLDFPLYAPQDPQLKTQNKQLQQKFDVRSYPTLILVDPQQNQRIGVTGYRPGGGKAYADFLIKMLNDHSAYKQKMGALNQSSKMSGNELKQLYEQAKKLSFENDLNKIISKGLHSDKALYFQIERYRLLASEGQLHSKEAVLLKQQLMAADPNNVKQIPYQLAVIDFESLASPESAIVPLTEYIEKFGNQDKDNLWRFQMIVAQVYLENNQMPIALKYAQDAYNSAPPAVQSEIAKAIQNIQTMMHAPLTAQAH